MPASGLLALLDDIATIADDVATLAGVAAKKTAGVVTDDMAVTAEQAVGIQRERELPVVWEVAKGSMKNKAIFLAPGALLLNAVAPWAITPILMAGGAFLCFEGVEKVIHRAQSHDADEPVDPTLTDPVAYERSRVDGAIRTDLILSGEIIAITLGEVATSPFVTQVGVLYAISVVMTVGVYGVVAGLVKLDDFGEYLVRAGGGRAGLGRSILRFTPSLMRGISIVGTVAMLLVGGQILLHGSPPVEHAVEAILHGLPGVLQGLVGAILEIAYGSVVGLIVVGVIATKVPGRIWRRARGMVGR